MCVKGLDMHAKVPYTSSLYMNTMSLCYNHSVNYKKKILHSREAFQYCHWPTLFLYISHIINFILINILKYFYDKDEINNISDTCKYNVGNRGCIGEPLASSKKKKFTLRCDYITATSSFFCIYILGIYGTFAFMSKP